MPKRIGTGIELLADPTRRQILALVARSVRRPSRIADVLGLSRPAVSRQLRLLTDAGLLDAWRYVGDGRGRSYYLNQRMTHSIVAWLAGTEVGLTPDQRSSSVRLPPLAGSDVEPATPSGAVRTMLRHGRNHPEASS